MASQTLELQIKGLYTAANNLSGMPQGALSRAKNVVIESSNLVASRRGQTQYNDPVTLTGDEKINKLFNYASSLIMNYADKMSYDNGAGLWVDYSGVYVPPPGAPMMRSLEALRNFYFTTSEGLYKLDGLTSTPIPAGVVKALGGVGTLTGSTGFLLDDSATAYRLVWGYRDSNNNLILGAPSQRVIVANSSGGNRDVSLNFLIPDTITTNYFYQIYRSNGTLLSTDTPNDELQLVIQANPTSGEIAAKSFTVIDSTPYILMRASLYTNQSQQGIENANAQPPLATDVDVFKNHAFYANVKQRETLTISMISVDSPSLGYVVDGTVGTTSGDNELTAIADTTLLRVGMRAVGTGIPANATITSIVNATTVEISANATATATVSVEFQDRFTIAGTNYWAGTTQNVATNTFLVVTGIDPGINIDQTAINLVEAINKSASNTLIYAYYISGAEDLPGQMLFENRTLGGAVFSVTSTAGTSFAPELPVSGATVASTNESQQNRVLVSKNGQVEAVPIYRFLDVGSANFPIQRVIALRDALIIFKVDGIFRISGETFESFSVGLLDNTVTLTASESVQAFNNQVFFMSNQGICACSDSGVELKSVQIENTLLTLSSEQFTAFPDVSFGVAYESSRLYLFFTVTLETDTYPTQCFAFNSLTNTWTRWEMDRTCGIVQTTSNKLFMGKADSGQTLIERKTFTNNDFCDEQYDITIDNVISDFQFAVTSSVQLVEGMTITQFNIYGDPETVITEVNDDNDVITVVSTRNFEDGDATVFEPIENEIEWQPIDAENPGILKQFSECTFFWKNMAFTQVEASFITNIALAPARVPLINNNLGLGWGQMEWGDSPWGGALGGQGVLRTYVPRNSQRCNWIQLRVTSNEAKTGFALQGVSLMYNPMSSRIK